VALTAFALALGVVGAGGGAFMYTVKSGTMAVIVAGEARAGELHRPPLRMGMLRQAYTFSVSTVTAAAHHYRGRASRLALGLTAAYGLLGLGLFAVVSLGLRWAAASSLAAALPALVLVVACVGLVGLATISLVFDLIRVVVVTDDCGVREGYARVRGFLLGDARHVLGVYAVMLIVSALGTALSLAATAGLALVAWVPVAGLLIVPLQILFWIARAALFQFLSLTALAAYQTQYRRFTSPVASPIPFARQQA
jgi:hypothetical protein